MATMPFIEYEGEFYPDFNYHLDLTKRRTSHRNDLNTDYSTGDFKIKSKTSVVRDMLNKKIARTKVWNDHKVYTFGALQTYLDDADAQNCSFVILSNNEFAAISKDKKK